MKKFTILETTILGFFVGVVISAYITFVSTTGGFIGVTLNWISLRPLFNLISVPESQMIVASFLFSVSVYTIYGAFLGFIAKRLSKPSRVILPLLVVIVGLAVFEQTINMNTVVAVDDSFQTASVIRAREKTAQQYFGTEATGDLNADGKDDVAFLISRNDDARGMLFYLSSALTTDLGKQGTNLIFLGDGVIPSHLFIAEGVITIEYTTVDSTETQIMYAQVTDSALEKVTM